MANINRDPKKGKAFEPIDFMPFADKPKPDPVEAYRQFVATVKRGKSKAQIEKERQLRAEQRRARRAQVTKAPKH